ncbi:hypothetical protein PILCRDRAFT_741990 [Piloderma croceum F 1598]|uniref:Protein kinase domain-containing protein n=1 Tax=Piloderma croceum (strain F 1598) TaxID=765440 RepID=A0A0C3EIA7_PILCF|nr:hypothetical protein PILCRDRAFT_741990 [Piloderma croceum F 1598]
MFLSHFPLLEIEYPDLVKTFRSMVELDPSRRPTAVAALNFVRAYHEGYTRAQLKGPVPEPNLDTMTLEERFKQVREANV